MTSDRIDIELNAMKCARLDAENAELRARLDRVEARLRDLEAVHRAEPMLAAIDADTSEAPRG